MTIVYYFYKLCTFAPRANDLSTLLPHQAYYVICSHISVCIHFNCQVYGGNLFSFFPFHLKNVFPADVVLGGNVVLINKNVLLFSQWQLSHIIFILRLEWKFEIRVCSDNSLGWPPSRSRSTKSIVSEQREVCSCAELQVSSGFTAWKKHYRRRA